LHSNYGIAPYQRMSHFAPFTFCTINPVKNIKQLSFFHCKTHLPCCSFQSEKGASGMAIQSACKHTLQ